MRRRRPGQSSPTSRSNRAVPSRSTVLIKRRPTRRWAEVPFRSMSHRGGTMRPQFNATNPVFKQRGMPCGDERGIPLCLGQYRTSGRDHKRRPLARGDSRHRRLLLCEQFESGSDQDDPTVARQQQLSPSCSHFNVNNRLRLGGYASRNRAGGIWATSI
jgi:hypothetical protein